MPMAVSCSVVYRLHHACLNESDQRAWTHLTSLLARLTRLTGCRQDPCQHHCSTVRYGTSDADRCATEALTERRAATASASSRFCSIDSQSHILTDQFLDTNATAAPHVALNCDCHQPGGYRTTQPKEPRRAPEGRSECLPAQQQRPSDVEYVQGTTYPYLPVNPIPNVVIMIISTQSQLEGLSPLYNEDTYLT